MAGWIAAWTGSPEAATYKVQFENGFADQTIRNIVFTSAGGQMARVRLSNAYGTGPLEIARAAIARADGGGSIAQGTSAAIRFSGRRSVVIPPGGSVLSDPIHLRVRALERLAVSVFVPHATGAPTDHLVASQSNYVATGNHLLDRTARAFRGHATSWYFVDEVDVWNPRQSLGTVVAFGDSITDGARSMIDANARWPNDLARRLDALGGRTLSVVDAGIAGNQLLYPTSCCGISGLARFGRDVLGVPSVRDVIVLLGINDIGRRPQLTAARMIAGYRTLIARAHRAGLKIFGATLTPFEGAFYWTPRGEAIREAVNAWILHGRAFDGVINFAAALADPGNPTRMRPAYDSGDHLHPNDAGYLAMARAVNLPMLFRGARAALDSAARG